MNHFQKQLIVFLIIIAAGLGLLLVFNSNPTPSPSPYQGEGVDGSWLAQNSSEISHVQIGLAILNVELAITPEQRERGLSGHKPLAINEAMLFVFDTPGKYGFWMKDMLFSIDMIWLSAEGKVVYIEKSVAPDTFPKSFASESPALYFLETKAGFSSQNNIKIGDQAKFLAL